MLLRWVFTVLTEMYISVAISAVLSIADTCSSTSRARSAVPRSSAPAGPGAAWHPSSPAGPGRAPAGAGTAGPARGHGAAPAAASHAPARTEAGAHAPVTGGRAHRHRLRS